MELYKFNLGKNNKINEQQPVMTTDCIIIKINGLRALEANFKT